MDAIDLQSRNTLVNGINIHYKIAGSGAPLLLLHGSPLTSHSWAGILPKLAETYLVIAPDLRGHGNSDKPEAGYEVHKMAEDLRQLVLQLGLSSISIIGHDLGGIVAYVYASQYGDEVQRLGIIEAPILGVPSPEMERVLSTYWHIGFYAHPTFPELLLAGRELDYLTTFTNTYSFKSDSFSKDDLVEYAHHLASAGGIRGVMGVYRAIASEIPLILAYTKKKLTMPVLAIGGDHSMSFGPFEQFKLLATTVQGCVVKDCGHWVAEEQGVRLLSDLEAFLR